MAQGVALKWVCRYMNVSEAQFESVDHTADIGYVCRGASLARLFETCAVSMAAVMFGMEPASEVTLTETLEVEADSVDELLVHFLNEILFLWGTAHLVPSEVSVDGITATHVSATVRGERYDPSRHHVLTDIKAATYHTLRVEERPDGWEAAVIFDV